MFLLVTVLGKIFTRGHSVLTFEHGGEVSLVVVAHGISHLRDIDFPFLQQCDCLLKTDVADELRKYKALFDDGILTQDEFEAKKKQLLNL